MAPLLAARRVQVVFRRMTDRMTFTVSDEGAGFDWQRYLDFAPERALDPNGRGIALARQTSFSSIDYLERGNIVVATIRVDPATPPETGPQGAGLPSG